MLTIRHAQLRALQQPLLAEERALLRDHARQFFGEQLRGVDDAQLLRACDRTRAAAFALGLRTRRDVLLWWNLTLSYGEEFLTRPECGWMHGRLTDPQVSSPSERLRLLYEEVVRREREAEASEVRDG